MCLPQLGCPGTWNLDSAQIFPPYHTPPLFTGPSGVDNMTHWPPPCWGGRGGKGQASSPPDTLKTREWTLWAFTHMPSGLSPRSLWVLDKHPSRGLPGTPALPGTCGRDLWGARATLVGFGWREVRACKGPTRPEVVYSRVHTCSGVEARLSVGGSCPPSPLRAVTWMVYLLPGSRDLWAGGQGEAPLPDCNCFHTGGPSCG